jgi:phage terminase small subunit
VERVAEGLTAKEERFCQEYIVDYNATKAAVRAGYKERSAATQGCRLLKNDKVASRVRELQEQYIKDRCFAEKDRVLKELWEVFEKASQKTEVMEWSQEKHAYVPTGEWTFDGKTATKAMELIGKMNGMFTEKIEHNAGNGGGFVVNVMVDDGKDD